MMKLIALCCFLFALVPLAASAQVNPDAYATGHKIYAGGEYTLFNSDYFGDNTTLNKSAFSVFGGYTLWDGRWPVAVEANYTRLTQQEGQNRQMSSLLIGPTVGHHFGRLEPFGKVGAGYGHFSAIGVPYLAQYGNHFAIGFGGGLKYHLTRHITLRPIDYTYERWNFSPHALSPSILGFGASYSFR